ncbi:MAG: hypothetical protein KA743_01405 [Geothrix sp.]|uniref:Uncharacterized protein n=1 Tax=Candidatus Geothrix odensensis TaxID=2954440 RepID=A0A936K7B9_9BACT|nr:hypothetical protein [Candidatus Geothrix odensensis]MBP7617139.1 hypothetical protein [Geothrix sp.]MCC6512489.1 hypothetical protein [Geothrix sp.]
MATPTRRLCPSCQTRLSPLAAECPECGLALAPPRQGRPMLFQASALAQASYEPPPRSLTAPALGRVAPVAVEVDPDELQRPGEATPLAPAPPQPALSSQEPAASFWPLVKVEAAEALLLVVVQGLALALPAWVLGIPPARLLLGAWPLVIPYLLATSWAFFMVPLALAGQSPMMGTFGVTLPENTAERRMTFSLVHLLSVVCFPLSFLCMILSPRHQTLAELLSGQELLARPTARMR